MGANGSAKSVTLQIEPRAAVLFCSGRSNAEGSSDVTCLVWRPCRACRSTRSAALLVRWPDGAVQVAGVEKRR